MSNFVERRMNQNHALVVVDAQKDFCEGGALPVAGGNDVAKKIGDYLEDRAEDYSVMVATKDWHISPGSHWSDTPDFVNSWPVHCAANSLGAMINPFINFHEFSSVFYKGQYSGGYSGFSGVNVDEKYLSEYLTAYKILYVDVVGLALDYCVKATAIDAAEKGYVTRVLLDKTAAVHSSPQDIHRVTKELERAGVECA